MTPAKITFVARNNEAWQEGFKLSLADGSAFDFGDYTPLRLQVKRDSGDPVAVLDLTDSDALSVETDGGLGINVAPADVAYLVGVYQFDLIGKDGTADMIVLATGTVTFEQGVTYTWP